MNNYEDRAMNHKRVRMDGEGGPGVVQGNGLPLNYMDNGHQIPYQPYAGSYNAHYPPADVAFGAYGSGELAGYAARGLAYAPPAHQPYPQPQPFQQQQMLHVPYEQQRPSHHHALKAWPPQPLMQHQPTQPAGDLKVKQEIKLEPSPADLAHAHALSSDLRLGYRVDSDPHHGNPMHDDSPKIKIKTDLFKESEAHNQSRRGVITESSEMDKMAPICDRSGGAKGDIEENKTVGSALAVAPKPDKLISDADCDLAKRQALPSGGESGSDLSKNLGENATTNTGNAAEGAAESGLELEGGEGEASKSRISDSGNSTDSANKNKFQGFSDSDSSSSSAEDDSKIPNDVYFGTPDMSTYRPKVAAVTPAIPTTPAAPLTPATPVHGKKRGRPKGSTNKPKPPEVLAARAAGLTPGTSVPRGPVGRPRGGGHSSGFMTHAIRPFKRDFSGIRFRRRWSDDGLDSAHIPNEVYFGDVPVSMEVLYNYYDAHAEREKLQLQQAKSQPQGSGNVTLVYSSSDTDSSDDSDSDSSGSDPNQVLATTLTSESIKRRPGRPRGSKTVNRRSDGPHTPASAHSPGDKPPGITDMKKFLKCAGIEFDYNKTIEGCTSNKERVGRLLQLLRDKGLEGDPTVEKCRVLYDGPPPRRRGPKPGTKRGPRKPKIPTPNSPSSTHGPPASPPDPLSPPEGKEDGERRVTRGQTSGKPRQRIVISSDEEDSHTPLSKLRTMR